MKKLALTLAAATVAIAFAVPASAETIKVKVGASHHRTAHAMVVHRPHAAIVVHRAKPRAIVVRHDRGMHRGFEHSKHIGYRG
jgi:hypothetical protein